MNKFFTLLLLTSFSFSFAQNWQTVSSKRISSFERENHFDYRISTANVLENIAIDSIELDNEDSIFYNFKTFYGDDNSSCNNLNDTSWLGTHVRIDTLGNNYFHSKYGDIFLIKTLADYGEVWSFGDSITATVEEISLDTIVDNVIDSLKIISLSNGNEIKISKNYGLVQSIRFGYFPSDSSEIFLVGIDDVGGVQTLTNRDIYDFEIGDEFHWFFENSDFFVFDREFTIHQVLNKSIIGNQDTIEYSIKKCFKNISNWSGSDFFYFNIDTISMKILDSDMPYLSFQSISDTNNDEGGFSFNFVNENKFGRLEMYSQTDYNFYGNDCWGVPPDGNWYNSYAEGLGNLGFDGSDFGSYYKNMVYYNKANGEEWGNTLGACETLSKNELIQSQISIYPNPATDVLSISSDNKSLINIEIYSSLGKLLLSEKGKSNYQINTSTLQKGVYLLKVKNSKGEVLRVEKIVKNEE